MDSAVTDQVLYVGDRERAERLAALGDWGVRWVASSGAALALLDGDSGFTCVVADDVAVAAEVDRRTADVVCLTADQTVGDPATGDGFDLLAAAVESAVDRADGSAFPVPVNEEARLDDLRPYLREPVLGANCFDRLAALACRLLKGHVGLVGLIDERLEHVVAASDEFPRSLPRDQTVCTHAILDNGPLVVEDVPGDDRFADCDLLDRLGIRAYAGVPICGRHGEAIGVLCVVDTIPRAFAPGDVDLLADLAEEATDQFELRRRMADDGGTVA